MAWVPLSSKSVNERTMRWGRTELTLIVNANMLALEIAVHDRAKARQGGRFDLQLANLSWIPALVLGVTLLLDNVIRVEVVHANLPRHPSGLVTEMWRRTHLFSIVPGGGGQRGEGNSTKGEHIQRPFVVYVTDLVDGTTRLLVEKSK